MELIYDAFNRLVRVERTSDTTTIAEYAYDAMSRRIRKDVDNIHTALNVEEVYFYEGSRVIEEQDFSGNVLRQYVWGASGELVQMRRPGSVIDNYVLCNASGSVLATTSSSGSLLDDIDYRIYGQHEVRNGELPGVSLIGLPYLYLGMRYDAETGFLLAGAARFLDPQNGRWLVRAAGGIPLSYGLNPFDRGKGGGCAKGPVFYADGSLTGEDPIDRWREERERRGKNPPPDPNDSGGMSLDPPQPEPYQPQSDPYGMEGWSLDPPMPGEGPRIHHLCEWFEVSRQCGEYVALIFNPWTRKDGLGYTSMFSYVIRVDHVTYRSLCHKKTRREDEQTHLGFHNITLPLDPWRVSPDGMFVKKVYISCDIWDRTQERPNRHLEPAPLRPR